MCIRDRGDVACVAFVVAAAAFASETAEEPSRREGGQQENDVHEDARQPPLDGRSEIPEQQEDDQDAQQAQADCPFFVHSRCVCGVFGALFAHDAFQFFDRDGDFPVADDAAARLRHEDVVLDADAAEIAVGIQRVVVDDALDVYKRQGAGCAPRKGPQETDRIGRVDVQVRLISCRKDLRSAFCRPSFV